MIIKLIVSCLDIQDDSIREFGAQEDHGSKSDTPNYVDDLGGPSNAKIEDAVIHGQHDHHHKHCAANVAFLLVAIHKVHEDAEIGIFLDQLETFVVRKLWFGFDLVLQLIGEENAHVGEKIIFDKDCTEIIAKHARRDGNISIPRQQEANMKGWSITEMSDCQHHHHEDSVAYKDHVYPMLYASDALDYFVGQKDTRNVSHDQVGFKQPITIVEKIDGEENVHEYAGEDVDGQTDKVMIPPPRLYHGVISISKLERPVLIGSHGQVGHRHDYDQIQGKQETHTIVTIQD